MRERGREARRPEGRKSAAAPPWPTAKARRRNPLERYGAPFSKPTARGDRGGRGELESNRCAAGEGPEQPAPWPTAENSSNVCSRGAREPRLARQKDEERAGGEGKLTNARKRGEKAPIGGTTRGDACCSGRTRGNRGEEREWGRKSRARARGLFKNFQGAGEGEGIVGAGSGRGGFSREREREVGAVGEGEADRRARPISGREREGEGRGPAGPGSRGRKGARRGARPKGRKEGRGEIPFPFSNKFSMHFLIGFLIKLIFVFKTFIT